MAARSRQLQLQQRILALPSDVYSPSAIQDMLMGMDPIPTQDEIVEAILAFDPAQANNFRAGGDYNIEIDQLPGTPARRILLESRDRHDRLVATFEVTVDPVTMTAVSPGATQAMLESLSGSFQRSPRPEEPRTYEELRASRTGSSVVQQSPTSAARQRVLDIFHRTAQQPAGSARITSATPEISSRRYLTFQGATSLIQSGRITQSIVDPENQEDLPPGLTRVTLIAIDGNEYDVVAKYDPRTNQILPPV